MKHLHEGVTYNWKLVHYHSKALWISIEFQACVLENKKTWIAFFGDMPQKGMEFLHAETWKIIRFSTFSEAAATVYSAAPTRNVPDGA